MPDQGRHNEFGIFCETNKFSNAQVSHEREPLAKKTASLIKKETLQFTAERAEIAEKENFNYPLRAPRSLR
jgi:hypothetical protein